MGALNGIKVLDITHFIAGPFCSQILADHGADVIKIEPLQGEFSRKANPMYEDLSLYFSSLNRNKKGLAIDLKSKEGREIIHQLVKQADVLITNYGVGVPERLGFDYETLESINPRIIMTHLTGFGLTGPYKTMSAFDGIIQAMSGIVHLTGEADGPPIKAGLYIADHIEGIQGALGTMLALYKRTVTNEGQLVDVSMLDSMVSMLAYNLADVTLLKNKPFRAGNDSTNVFATTFKTKDGYVYIAPLTARMWENFCAVINRPEWAEENSRYVNVNERLSNYPELKKEIHKWTIERSTAETVSLLQGANVACAAVSDMEDVINNPQLKERGMLTSINIPEYGDILVPGKPIKLNKTNSPPPERPPYLGEHSSEILAESGYTQEEIHDFISKEVIFQR